jgi:putative flippase GtrA
LDNTTPISEVDENAVELDINLGGHHVSFTRSFIRSIFTSLIATSVDYTISIFAAKYFNVYYVLATSIGCLFGAIASFYLSRQWVYEKKSGKVTKQFLRFAFINFISASLNTFGVFFVVEQSGLSFVYSRIIVSVFVGLSFNFLMNRYFVFKS